MRLILAVAEAQECAEDAAAVIAGLKGFGMLYHVASVIAIHSQSVEWNLT
jgi:hypothetical protein